MSRFPEPFDQVLRSPGWNERFPQLLDGVEHTVTLDLPRFVTSTLAWTLHDVHDPVFERARDGRISRQ
jgi:hypothetical protein